MGPLTKLLLGILVISLATFIALFGRLPALRKTPIGALNRFLLDYIPAWLRRIDYKLTGGVIGRLLDQTGHYLFFKKNPLVLIIFLTILSGSAFLFIKATYSDLTTSQWLPIPPLLLAPYLFTYLCVTSRSSYISPSNHHARLRDYPYDHILFRPNVTCKTCNLVKPARSKHCSLCGVCVARCDHHCPWVNNCLGRHNYRYFLALLLSLGILEIYGAHLAYRVMAPNLNVHFNTIGIYIWNRAYWKKMAAVLVDAAHRGGLSITGVGLLAATTAPLPLALLAYHIYLVWAGMTTNESQKWSFWKEDMADGIVFKAKRSDLVAHKQLMRNQLEANGSRGGRLERRVSLLAEDETDDLRVDWPVSSDQVVVRTNDGQPPVGREYLYEHIWDLSRVDNIYDLGFWDNLMYVLQAR